MNPEEMAMHGNAFTPYAEQNSYGDQPPNYSREIAEYLRGRSASHKFKAPLQGLGAAVSGGLAIMEPTMVGKAIFGPAAAYLAHRSAANAMMWQRMQQGADMWDARYDPNDPNGVRQNGPMPQAAYPREGY